MGFGFSRRKGSKKKEKGRREAKSRSMWGFGGNYYWGRKQGRGSKVEGIVVVFAWMSSQEKHLNNYVDLYSSLGWDSLICQSQFLNLFFPDKAAAFALEIVTELVKELRIRPCPIVFTSFSGGPKACMYKVIQIIEKKFGEELLHMDEHQLVRDCISGFIFDSAPVDFTSDLGTQFILHPTVLKMPRPPPLASWLANAIASCLDGIFLSRFEAQRAEYWQTLFSTVSIGAPYLILCSEDDDLAPCHIICNFSQRIQQLGGDVELIKWCSSSHVGHYRHYPSEYKAAVAELLVKATLCYSKKTSQLVGDKRGLEGTIHGIPESFCDLRKAATSSQQSLQRITLDLNDHFFVPSSVEYHEYRDVGSIPDGSKERFVPLSATPSINPHGILGQYLFGVLVPKNIENWDINSSSSTSTASSTSPQSRRASSSSSRRGSSFNPIKCIRRSRL